MSSIRLVLAFVIAVSVGLVAKPVFAADPPENPQQGSIGLQGELRGKPPSTPAVITVPGNGQNFTSTPTTVAGICTSGLLVEIYKNDVFAGSVTCVNGAFSLLVDLFDGKNDLVARVFDALNQAGPDSATVSVNYNSNKPTIGPRLVIVTPYSKRGAIPGNTLTYPITLSGGLGPYAISVDWGDKSSTDLFSRPFAGELSLEHVYKQAGVYTIIIKATDASGNTAFLEVVGIGNGPIQQNSKDSTSATIITQTKVIWWPLIIAFILILVSFYLGKRQEIEQIRGRIRAGKRPF